MRALLRRAAIPDRTTKPSLISIDPETRSARVSDLHLGITSIQFGLLHELVRHRNRVVQHRDLVTTIWNQDSRAARNNLKAQIARLRARIRAAGSTEEIVSVRGTGYRLEPRHNPNPAG